MASITTEKNGRRTIQFVGADAKRRSIRLGKVSKRMAEAIQLKVEVLAAAKLTGHAVDDETSRWIAGLENVLADKLVRVGLTPKRQPKIAAPLGPFLSEYVEKRIDVKPATKVIWGQVVRNLRDFFGDQRELSTIFESDAEDFKMHLISQELASTTIHKRLQFARMFFAGAVKRRLIDSNPFADVTAVAVIDEDKKHFVTREDTASLLQACDAEWKLIVSLCRFGGLRCPSEVLSLRWQDVNWEIERINVPSPKTAHHPGRDRRVIPLFPELRAPLQAALSRAAEGAIYVVENERLRTAAQGKDGWRNCNLRTQFERIIARAGLKPWPKLFHALRASRETELAQVFPQHVLVSWFGHSTRVAEKHYLRVTDSDYRRAVQAGAICGAEQVQNAGQQPAASHGSEWQEITQAPDGAGAYAERCDWLPHHAENSSGGQGIRTLNRLPGI